MDIIYTHIEKLDSNLFESNKNLEEITIYNSKITRIDHGTFDGLAKLKTLWLTKNPCTSDSDKAENNKAGVLRLIQLLEFKCKN